jgi:hypothetical protein
MRVASRVRVFVCECVASELAAGLWILSYLYVKKERVSLVGP